MNFHSDEWVMERLHEHWDEALTLFDRRHIVGLFVQGSTNYGLDVENSDLDTKLITTPYLSELVFNESPVSTTHVRANNEHIDLKDIRLYMKTFRKGNLNFMEILFTPYFILNPMYETQWNFLVQEREKIARMDQYASLKAMYGMAAEKYQKHLPEEKRRAFRASLGICARMRTLVTVSRLSKEKNVQELISFLPALIRKNPNIKLLIVGDGPYKKRLEGLTEKLQLSDSVIFTGMVPSEDVWRYYDAGDLFVSASTFEVHSMSYLESLANGLPLLCRADDALAGVLDHGKNGMIYHSEKEFVDYTIRILADERIRKDMGRRSLLMAENYSSGTFASSVFSVYEDAIHENAKRK